MNLGTVITSTWGIEGKNRNGRSKKIKRSFHKRARAAIRTAIQSGRDPDAVTIDRLSSHYW